MTPGGFHGPRRPPGTRELAAATPQHRSLAALFFNVDLRSVEVRGPNSGFSGGSDAIVLEAIFKNQIQADFEEKLPLILFRQLCKPVSPFTLKDIRYEIFFFLIWGEC